jgi:hypothetical protein
MEVENTLAYYGTATIMELKCFIIQSTGAYPTVDFLKGAPLGWVPALSENS